RRRKKRLPDQMYDVTGWHLPSAYDVEVVALDRPLTAVRTQPVTALAPVTLASARVGYVMPWGLGAARLVVAAQAAGLRVRFADEGFAVGGRSYPMGTAIFRSAENPADLPATLGRLVSEHRADVVA